MPTVSLLDCTLRDGGYVNDWKFGHKNLVSIFERLVDANVDLIEIGFLDERRPFDIDRSIMPDTACAEKIFGQCDRKQAMVLGMIDYGTCGIEHLQPCSESFLDGIRVIFKKHRMHEAMEFCRQVKALGYKVFAQLVSITAYNDAELLSLIDLVNDVKPYAVSIVDTYGLLHPDELLHYYELMDKHVCPSVQIGFHAHNNFQLAYANDLAFISKKSRHDIVVDGTLFGMGKSAGNTPIELLGMRLNDKFGKNYRVDAMLECVEESVLNFYQKSPWGYKTFFYLCSKNKCHPNYLTYFEKEKNLSTSKIDALLSRIEPEDKKLLYDKEIARQLYEEYIDGEGSDEADKTAFKQSLGARPLLIIGPGKNIQLQKQKVRHFIEAKHPYILSVNYLPKDFVPDCVFITNSNRYHDMTLTLRDTSVKVLATTNVECRNGSFNYVIQRAPLLETDETIIDNSFLMLVKFLQSIGINEIFCAGFDGYSDKEDNYVNPAMEYGFVKQQATHLNEHMKSRITEFRNTMRIMFITYSAYDETEDINGASI